MQNRASVEAIEEKSVDADNSFDLAEDSMDSEEKKVDSVDPIAQILANVANSVKKDAKEDEKDTNGFDFEKTFTKRYNSKEKIYFFC